VIELCLAIETSCDDTSVAVVRNDGYVLGVRSAHQDMAHAPFGGIVPEIACRNHSLHLLPLVDETLRQLGIEWSAIQGIAVTNRPGLIGSLIVGLVTAKSLAQARGLPLIGVNHLEGHILAPFLRDDSYAPSFAWNEPFLALAVSGGHTTIYKVNGLGAYEILGTTLDDAAGEAFDKFAKMAGLPFPGGVKVDQLSQSGNPKTYDFPRSMLKEENDMMSFSGLKSSAQRLLATLSAAEIQDQLPDLCASFQEAIVDVLLGKLQRAAAHTGLKKVVITGGVSANSRLRSRAEAWTKQAGLQLQIPPLRYCTDNAAMIGYAGILRLNRGERSDLSLGPSPGSWPQDFQGQQRARR
jgi:N6-L-threonylcarbamoyladenine synthase